MSRSKSYDQSAATEHTGLTLPSRGSRRASSPIAKAPPLGLTRVFSGIVKRRPSDAQEDEKGPLGLESLVLPADPIVDFVFVHGLGGGSHKTWRSQASGAYFWPKEWLSQDPDFKNVRIHTFGYDSDYWESRRSVMDITDYGNKLLAALQLSVWFRQNSSLPIVFVAHSMGGLVVKEAFLISLLNPAYANLSGRFHAIFFLATPHHGSHMASILSTILKLTDHGHKPFVGDLQPESQTIMRINDQFRHHANKLHLVSFFENRPTLLGVKKEFVVDKSAARMNLPAEIVVDLDADHRHVCKFNDPSDTNYVTVRNAFVDLVVKIEESWLCSHRELGRERRRRLMNFFAITTDSSHTLRDFGEPRVEGSCEWILDKPEFGCWRDEPGTSILALYAAPAMGKSYVADFVREHLESLGRYSSAFFFEADNAATNSVSKCLTHFAFDMACQIPRIGNAFLEMQNDDFSVENYADRPRILWQKLFVNCIFKHELHWPFFWVIDALDECRRHEELASFLSTLDPIFPLRVFVTSRPNHELEQKLSIAKASSSTLKLLPQDNRNDIESYIRVNLRVFENERAEVRTRVKNSIIKKSEGCFLWVKLVVCELRQAQSTKRLQQVLEKLPVGMDKLYNRSVAMLRSTSQDIQLMTSAILRWTLHSIRPLTVEELREAMEFDLDDEIPNLQNQVSSLSGNMLYVDAQSRVRLIHQTVKTYLVNEAAAAKDPSLNLDEATCHRRIAATCLKYFCKPDFRAPAARRQGQHRKQHPKFADYAAFFYEHIRHCSAGDEEIFDQLSAFFRNPHGNVLVWIEHIAMEKDLNQLSRAGMILSSYLRRRVKYFPLIGKDAEALKGWSIDLIRLVAKFGHNLLHAPSSILNIIPPLCPKTSTIFQLYGARQAMLTVSGLASRDWDDQLASLVYPEEGLTSIACSSSYFAIASSRKLVRLYHISTCQLFVCFNLKESAKALEFNASGQLLLCAGSKRLYVWDMSSRDCLMEVSIHSPCVAAAFSAKGTHIWIICKDNSLYTYPVKHVSENEECQADKEELYINAYHTKKSSRPPDTAAFSVEHDLLAFVYRGGHINVWNVAQNGFQAECQKPLASTQRLPFHATSLVFNPRHAEILAAGYEDGLLIIFDPWTGDITATYHQNEEDAPMLACSLDGRTLVSGNSDGLIRAFDFESFESNHIKVVHVIQSRRDNIRALAFCDNVRFVDMRASASSIWDPAALVRQDEDDEISDMASIDLQEQVSSAATVVDSITCVVVDPEWGVVFAATENGDVCAYDLDDGSKLALLYSHTAEVLYICYDAATCTLATADSASQVRAYSLLNRGQKQLTTKKMLLSHRMNDPVEQLLLNPEGTHLQIVTTSRDDLCALEHQDVRSVQWATRNRGIWTTHPQNARQMLLITCAQIRIFTWNGLKPASPANNGIDIEMELPPKFELKAVYIGWHGRILITEYTDSLRARSRTRLYLWDISSITPTSRLIRPHTGPLQRFGDILASLIGTLGSMIGTANLRSGGGSGGGGSDCIMFLNNEGWICSVEMGAETPQCYTRHFFPPIDWLSTNDEVPIRCTSRREVVFVKEHEIAIIRGGLDCVESVPFEAKCWEGYT